ncbi:MAG: hypothetical protein HFH45_00395 [Bacilli bacterium]|nr:hypothetical protein [Bacilli bacterium]
MSKISRNKNKQKKLILVSAFSLLCILSVGYAAFQTALNITAKGNISSKEIESNDLKELVVTSGDGLYKDTYEEGRYIYKGGNPNNYITFNDELWRIVSVESDGTLKIMKSSIIVNSQWDTDGLNNWERPSDLNTYLNSDYYNTLSETAKSQIQTHLWYVGGVHFDVGSLEGMINEEKSGTWNGKIAMVSVSDYYKANSNVSLCGDFDSELNNRNDGFCKTTNYMFTAETTTDNLVWMVSPCAKNSNYVWFVNMELGYAGVDGAQLNHGLLPAVYLKADIKLSGEGTETNPYTIN